MIKMLVASVIGLSISYSGKIIPSWFFKCIHAVLLVLPIVLLSLGVSGKFNVFKMDEYIKGNYELKTKGSDGQYYKDNLKKQDEKTAHNRFRAAGLRRRKPSTDQQQKRKEYENDRLDQGRLSEEGRRL